jgi:tRNA modification GTPase
VPLRLSGLPLTLIDTAGLRDTDDAIEAEGVRRARARADRADLILWLSPVDAPQSPPPGFAAPLVLLHTKCDLAMAADEAGLPVSTLNGAGMQALLALLADRAASAMTSSEAPAITRARHRHALEACHAHLLAALAQSSDIVLAAEELRLATRALGRITGRVDVDDVLGAIFSSFCIGK